MTNEEAIYVIKNTSINLGRRNGKDIYAEALNMAIKALEHPEITLESAIDYLHSIGWMQEHDRIMTEPAQPDTVRCKDCIYWWESHKMCKRNKDKNYNCACMECDADFYCKNAERRTDD